MSVTRDYAVSGLTCQHCADAVTEEVTALPGVEDVGVAVHAGGTSILTVSSEAPLADEDIAHALDEAGDYRLAV